MNCFAIYIYIYNRKMCLSICLSFVAILLPNYWMNPHQNWYGHPPKPWECPSILFWGTREGYNFGKTQ